MATFRKEDFHYHLDENEKEESTRLIGFEFEIEREDRNESQWLADSRENVEGFANFGYDGGDIEVVSDPISKSLLEQGGEIIKNVLDILNNKHCSPCFRGGTHINVSKLKTDYRWTYDNLMWLQIVYAPEMKKIFGRQSHWAESPLCKIYTSRYGDYSNSQFKDAKFTKEIFDIFISKVPGVAESMSKSYNKDLLIQDKGNRYEFRGGKSTINLLEALAWGEFCCNMVEIAATKENLSGVKFADFIKGEHIEKYVNEVVNASTTRKLGARDLSKTVCRTKRLTITRDDDEVYN